MKRFSSEEISVMYQILSNEKNEWRKTFINAEISKALSLENSSKSVFNMWVWILFATLNSVSILSFSIVVFLILDILFRLLDTRQVRCC